MYSTPIDSFTLCSPDPPLLQLIPGKTLLHIMYIHVPHVRKSHRLKGGKECDSVYLYKKLSHLKKRYENTTP